MIPYRVSVLAPIATNHTSHEVKLYATFAETDNEALCNVSGMMPDGWRVDRVSGLLSRLEVDRFRLAFGEVREISSFVVDSVLIPENALYDRQEKRKSAINRKSN